MDRELLAQYAVTLEFCSRTLQEPPGRSLLRNLAHGGLFADLRGWPCFEACARADIMWGGVLRPEPSLAALAAAYSADAEKEQDRLDRLHRDLRLDHLALFSGPNPQAPPWESVWRERDRLLFGRRTRLVCDCYGEWGLRIEQAGREPEDHLGLELAFLLFLLRAMDRGAASGLGRTPREALAAFIDDHVLDWAGSCLRKASEEASSTFYREMPRLCCLMLGNLRDHAAA
jgi:TorA maturation chaperone TorD